MKLEEISKLLKKCVDDDTPMVLKGIANNILSDEEFERMLNLRPFVTTSRIKPTNGWNEHQWFGEPYDSDVNSIPYDVLQEHIDQGVMIINDASRWNKSMNDLCMHIENEFNMPADCHIFFSKNPSIQNSFSMHKDPQHNVIVQTSGQTNWRVGSKPFIGNHYPRNLEFDTLIDGDSLAVDEILSPGDAVFIPAEFYHQPRNITKRVSVSFTVDPNPEVSRVKRERRWMQW
jgi:hypothetical protein